MDTAGSIIELGRSALIASKRHYLVVLTSAILFVLAATAFSLIRGPLYTSTMTLKAASSQPTSAISSALKSLPISIGNTEEGELLSSYVALLQSDEIARLLIERENISRLIFADRINQDGSWSNSPVHFVKSAMNGVFGVDTQSSPTVSDVRRYLIEHVAVSQDQMSGLVTASCTSPIPTLCRNLLLATHRQAEFRLGEIQREQSIRTRDYVLRIIGGITQTDTIQYLHETLSNANNQIALAQLEKPVAAIIVSPPLIPITPSFPKPGLMMVIGLALGLSFGLSIALFKSSRAKPV